MLRYFVVQLKNKKTHNKRHYFDYQSSLLAARKFCLFDSVRNMFTKKANFLRTKTMEWITADFCRR